MILTSHLSVNGNSVILLQFPLHCPARRVAVRNNLRRFVNAGLIAAAAPLGAFARVLQHHSLGQ